MTWLPLGKNENVDTSKKTSVEACVPQVMIEVQWSYRCGGVGWIKLNKDGSGKEM